MKIRRIIEVCKEYYNRFVWLMWCKLLKQQVRIRYLKAMQAVADQALDRRLIDQLQETYPTSKTPINYNRVKDQLIISNIVVDNVVKEMVKQGKTQDEIRESFWNFSDDGQKKLRDAIVKSDIWSYTASELS